MEEFLLPTSNLVRLGNGVITVGRSYRAHSQARKWLKGSLELVANLEVKCLIKSKKLPMDQTCRLGLKSMSGN